MEAKPWPTGRLVAALKTKLHLSRLRLTTVRLATHVGEINESLLPLWRRRTPETDEAVAAKRQRGPRSSSHASATLVWARPLTSPLNVDPVKAFFSYESTTRSLSTLRPPEPTSPSDGRATRWASDAASQRSVGYLSRLVLLLACFESFPLLTFKASTSFVRCTDDEHHPVMLSVVCVRRWMGDCPLGHRL
jgi:hypothetical protein